MPDTPSPACYLRLPNRWQPSWSCDGRRLSYLSDEDGLSVAWVVELDNLQHTKVGLPERRTIQARFAPAGDLLLLAADSDGDERQQLWGFDDGPSPRPLTHDPKFNHLLGACSPDGLHFAYSTVPTESAGPFEVRVQAADGSRPRTVWTGSELCLVLDWHPSKTALLVSIRHTNMANDLLIIDDEIGEVIPITSHKVPARYEEARFNDDGEAILLATDLGCEHLRFARLKLSQDELTFITPDDRDVDEIALSADRRHVVVTRNARGFSEVLAGDIGKPLAPVRDLPGDLIASPVLSPAGNCLAYSRHDFSRPADIWIARRDGRSARSVTPGTSDESLPTAGAAAVSYKSFDGREISGLFSEPAGGSRAAIVSVHGGPEAQTRPYFDPFVQALVATGFAILSPNIRGSTGYGKTFASLDDGPKRPDAVRDVCSAADWLRHRGFQRVGVMGGSYGGFVVLSALADAPGVFDAGVAIAAIANLVSFLEHTPAFRRPNREAEYGFLRRDRALLESLSPVHKVRQIRAPLLLIHGANDPRVPVAEAQQMCEALRSMSKSVVLRIYETEGHDLARPENQLDAFHRISEFFTTHLTAECRLARHAP